MPKNSSAPAPAGKNKWKDVRFVLRVALAVLLGANLVAAGLVLFPPGGSAEDLERQLATLQTQVAQGKATLERTRQHVAAVEQGREQGDKFLAEYFLPRRTAYSIVEAELGEAAAAAKIKPRERSYDTQPIEGSDTLSMMSITANFEGPYRDILNFVHALDKSPRLLMIESLNAAPQQGTNALVVSMKIDTFVREGDGL
jgi:type IV pilus assembly protein PilO